jgi:hypothetical protein
MPNLCFYIRGTICRLTNYHAQAGLVLLPQKCAVTYYAELVFLHLVQSMGHVLRSATCKA